MGNPKIGSFATKRSTPLPTPLPEDTRPGGPAPDPVIDKEDIGTVHDFVDLTEPLGVAPNPPRCLAKKFEQRDLVWRWLSEPQVDRLGLRMYTVYSPDAKERELINSGKDAPPGVRVDAENRVRWLDDAFLGVLNRRYFQERYDQKRKRVRDLTEASRNLSALKDKAARVKGHVDVDIKRWRADELDDREPS